MPSSSIRSWRWMAATAGPVSPNSSSRASPPAVEAIVDADEVAAHVASGGVVVDSRDRARYLGETEPIDRIAGHVPGAINLPFTENLTAGVFRPPAELAKRFAALRADPQAIVYCGSGVTACHNALAAEAAGLPPLRVYVGSWSGWTADPDRPVATGPVPIVEAFQALGLAAGDRAMVQVDPSRRQVDVLYRT